MNLLLRIAVIALKAVTLLIALALNRWFGPFYAAWFLDMARALQSATARAFAWCRPGTTKTSSPSCKPPLAIAIGAGVVRER